MALKFKYGSKDEVPAELVSLYAERDGAWQLDVEGVADKGKLDELRNHHAALLKQLDEHKQRFEGIDPDQVRTLAEEKQRLEEERQLKAGELDKVVENRVKGLRTDWEKQVATFQVRTGFYPSEKD
jgi:predicted nuclease with TOPRIM domain